MLIVSSTIVQLYRDYQYFMEWESTDIHKFRETPVLA